MKPETDIHSAASIADGVVSGKLSAIDVTNAALARIVKHDRELNSFTDLLADRARRQAC